jgi:hypothetical protein
MNPTSLSYLKTLLQDWQQLLSNWARNGMLSSAAQEALLLGGEREQLHFLMKDCSESNLSALPQVVLQPAASMPGAAGAYAISTGTIYLNQDWLANANKLQALAVHTEELGHLLDGLLNSSDTPGDEGKLFEALLHGDEVISAQKRERVKVENNQGSVLIQGEVLAVEKSTEVGPTAEEDRPVLIARSGGEHGVEKAERAAGVEQIADSDASKKPLLTY